MANCTRLREDEQADVGHSSWVGKAIPKHNGRRRLTSAFLYLCQLNVRL